MEFENIIKMIQNDDFLYNKNTIQEYFLKNNSDVLISKIVNLKNPQLYLRFMYVLEDKIDIDDFDNKRNSFIKKAINNTLIDKEIFSFFKDNQFLKELFGQEKEKFESSEKKEEALKEISNNWLKEDIIYYFFHDNYYNFLVNFNQMLKYMDSIQDILISKEHIDFYQLCVNLDQLSFKEKIAFFNKYSMKEKTWEMFYDDMRIIKNHSYHNLVHSALKIKESKSLYNEELSHKYQTPVYYLDGEKFYAFVRYIKPRKEISSYEKYLNGNLEREYYSFSYIGSNISTIGKNKDGLHLLYDNINPEFIAHVYHDDSGAVNALRKGTFSRVYNEIYTPKSLMYNTNYYNEIVLKNIDGIKPSALVCFDKIDNTTLTISLKYHLPIVLINSKKYYYSNDYTDFSDNDTYSI